MKGGTPALAKKRRRDRLLFLGLGAYAVVLAGLVYFEVPVGAEAARTLFSFTASMAAILPAAFVLIGLFEVWVPREVVERHVGEGTGTLSYIWAILLAGSTVGGIYVSFPVAYALRQKGARLSFVLAYITLSGVARIPMTLFEISTLGLPFTVIRYLVAVPLVVGIAHLWGRRLEAREFRLSAPENEA
ncbi:MAG: hypothetical protein ACOCW6_07470 [Spirochaetota bacterium]